MTTRYDYTFQAGDTEHILLAYLDASSTPIDLTGVTARVQLRAVKTDEIETLEVLGVIDIPTAELAFTFSAEETEALIPIGELRARYYYDVEVTYPNSDVETLITGVITVILGVSRNRR